VAHKGAMTRQHANDSDAAKKDSRYNDARKSEDKANKTFAKSWSRRKGMAKAVDRLTKEESEQIDELSKKTLSSYTNKAALDVHNNAFRAGGKMSSGDIKGMKDNMVKSLKRQIGIGKAAKKLAKD
jgi:hypothetical protein